MSGTCVRMSEAGWLCSQSRPGTAQLVGGNAFAVRSGLARRAGGVLSTEPTRRISFPRCYVLNRRRSDFGASARGGQDAREEGLAQIPGPLPSFGRLSERRTETAAGGAPRLWGHFLVSGRGQGRTRTLSGPAGNATVLHTCSN